MTAMPWVERWAGMIPSHGRVLDLACGGGRHAVYLAARGHAVDAVDIDLALSEPVRDTAGVNWHQYDLETRSWPFAVGAYQGAVVTNYLHRPLFPHLIAALAPGGVLVYATFSMGQEVYGRPRNPSHLLMPGELLEAVRGRMRIVAYEDVLEGGETPARVQRLCAIKN
ncbi:MAG: methyltransferase domain-containing protein [Thiobacillus sp.]|nr:methyltransferase domain-containing protein [Thiobacillus sp.]